MVTDGDWRTTFRPDIPSSARIYDYFLGGKDNFPADREAGDEITGYLPGIRQAAQWNRAFVGRAVRFLVKEAGITQLLDIGSGLPTKGNVHEVAHEVDPEIRVVYVDHDPVVLVHARDERLLLNGSWQDGLVPTDGVARDELAQQARFFAYTDTLRSMVGSDGRKVFCVPLALSSQDRAWRSLDTLNFRQWLLDHGYTAPTLHWYLN